MALFDFICKKCQHRIEDVITTYEKSDAPKDCPSCGGKETAVRKDFYQTWFNFMGAGWGGGSANCSNFKG